MTTPSGTATSPSIGRLGIWTWTLDAAPMSQSREAVAELEELGFGAVWIPEAVGREPFAHAALLLASTKSIVVATGIASMYARTAVTMQAGHKTLTEAFGDRFLLGIGASHAHMAKALHKSAYDKPYSTMVEYLDTMDSAPFAAATPQTAPRRVLAALGPKMLALAAERADGAHPYFTTPDHTAMAREILGPDPILAPEQAVILSEDAHEARELGRKFMSTYLRLPNYANNLLRIGFTEDDVKGANGQPSDRLVDAICCWGSLDTIATRLREHVDAGASHVSVQVLSGDLVTMPRREWRELASLVSAF
jgi:probable F420-dependent oxidoreductase